MNFTFQIISRNKCSFQLFIWVCLWIWYSNIQQGSIVNKNQHQENFSAVRDPHTNSFRLMMPYWEEGSVVLEAVDLLFPLTLHFIGFTNYSWNPNSSYVNLVHKFNEKTKQSYPAGHSFLIVFFLYTLLW